jgi:hypothetical protein
MERHVAPAVCPAAVLTRHMGSVLWNGDRCDLYPTALACVGLDPARIIFVKARHGALRAMEEGLRHFGLAGVMCKHEGCLDFVASVGGHVEISTVHGDNSVHIACKFTSKALSAITSYRLGDDLGIFAGCARMSS